MNGYSGGQRAVETAGVAAWAGAFTVASSRIGGALEPADLPLAAIVIALAWLAADFLSGVVHWACDTWGDTDVPVVGPTLLRGFREHHADPEAITRHDFVETNGAVALATLPLLVLAVPAASGGPQGRLAAVGLVALAVWLLLTNQIHRWAHLAVPPRGVRLLQRCGVVLPPGHHARHHRAPFVGHYCITSGWWNRPLAALGFFAGLERLIERVTGARPRRYATAISDAVSFPAP